MSARIGNPGERIAAPDPETAAPDAETAAPHLETAATESPLERAGEGSARAAQQPEAVGDGGENTTVDLARIGWLGTVVACLIAVVILLINGYDGYAAVTFAVALSAAINLR